MSDSTPDAPASDLLPVRSPDLRDHLPGIETERHVDDWGRSERVEGLVDRTLVDFYYRHWFRVEAEGVENVPSGDGALLVANQSGALPPEAPMIAKALREEHSRPRPLHIAIDGAFRGYPGVSMLVSKLGGVAAHPANVQRLLHDERALVLAFPEGKAVRAKLYRERYRVRPFGAEIVAAAMRASAPIVPVAVVGAEEAAPVFGRLSVLRGLARLPRLPVTPTFPALGPLGILGYLPAKLRIRFLEPIPTTQWGAQPWEDQGLVADVAGELRGMIQEHLVELVGRRESVWFG